MRKYFPFLRATTSSVSSSTGVFTPSRPASANGSWTGWRSRSSNTSSSPSSSTRWNSPPT